MTTAPSISERVNAAPMSTVPSPSASWRNQCNDQPLIGKVRPPSGPWNESTKMTAIGPYMNSTKNAKTAASGQKPGARASLKELREAWLAPLEKRYLGELLAEHGGSVRKAAAAAGVDAVTLYRLLRKRGVTVARQVVAD